MSLSANMERFRVQNWLADLRVGGHAAPRLQLAGDCTAPVTIFGRGLPDKLLVELGLEKERPSVIWLETRCRKCQPCLTKRSQLWAARARDELGFATRTWFATFTLSPHQALRAKFAAERWLTKRGHSLDQVSEGELFKATVRFVNPELTKWLKRIRKNSGAGLRYVLVCEAHKSGVPHWHALIHEYAGKVTKRELEASWRYGISHFRLVDREDEQTAFYVAKYLSKSALTRVRASKHYGAVSAAHKTEQLEELLRAITFSSPKRKST